MPLPDPMDVFDLDNGGEMWEYLRGRPDSFYPEVLEYFFNEKLMPEKLMPPPTTRSSR